MLHIPYSPFSLCQDLERCCCQRPWVNLTNQSKMFLGSGQICVSCNWAICFLFLLESSSVFIAWWAIWLILATKFLSVYYLPDNMLVFYIHLFNPYRSPWWPKTAKLVNAWAVFYLRSLLPQSLPYTLQPATHREEQPPYCSNPAGDYKIKLFLSAQTGFKLFGR